MGGDSVFIEGPIGVREPLKDVARNLDRWVNGIVARVFSQATVEELARVVVGAGDQRAERRCTIPARRWPMCRPSASISGDCRA